MNKNAIKKFAIDARNKLIASVTDKAGMLGITANGISDAITKGRDFEVYKTSAGTEVTLNRTQSEQRRRLVAQIEARGFEAVIEEVAYTWFNRICAIRFMEVNDYLPVRVLSSIKDGKTEPDIVTNAPDVDIDFSDAEKSFILEAKVGNKLDELFRMLFIKQCHELNDILPELFEKTEDYTEMLLNISYTNEDDVIRMLVDTVDENDFNVTTLGDDGKPTGQVEIIGWLYQYYNTELKDDTFAKLKKNVKITKERIPAATQLFTPDWIVRYMVENSVGRIWIEHLRAVDSSVDEKITAENFGWKYYLPEAEQEESVNVKLAEIRTSYANLKPEDITCIDPCMGSGHILIAMFDVLMDIYKSTGYSEKEAAFSIVENNIHGLDIDKRAYQLAYFAVMMKGRGYNRRFFRGHDDMKPQPKVYAIYESNYINLKHIEYMGAGLSELEKREAKNQLLKLIDETRNAKEYGSLLTLSAFDSKLLYQFVVNTNEENQLTFDTIGIEDTKDKLIYLIKSCEVICKKYDILITNPPYMASKGMSDRLLQYVQTAYPEGKSDLFSCFIDRGFAYVKNNGFNVQVTMQVWMFLTAYEKFRKKVYETSHIINLLHMDNMVMGIAFGTSATVFRKGIMQEYNGRYSYVEMKDLEENDEPSSFPVENERLTTSSISKYIGLPRLSLAYWVTAANAQGYKNPSLEAVADVKKGMSTADDATFIRMWHEIEKSKMQGFCPFECAKWFWLNKGGSFRRWYGNNSFVVNWENDGMKMKNFKKAVIRNVDYYFRDEGLTWTYVTNYKLNVRYYEKFAFAAVGPCIFPHKDVPLEYIMGVLNSVVAQLYADNVGGETITYEVGEVATIPIIKADSTIEQEVIRLVKENISISREDWDSKEISWDFKKSPLIQDVNSIEEAYLNYKERCLSNRAVIKKNEKRLNEIFIELYGLEDELSPDVDEKDIVLDIADRKQVIKDFVSYIVGCMFGRYSLEKDGLICAGQNIDEGNYGKCIPDSDGIIPMLDEQYFDGDIVAFFESYVEVIFGKENLDINMQFIAESLGGKGESPREQIRSYFMNSFFDDHCDRYSVTGTGRRPIYWLFDSGKSNGFKCLIYMHRYNKDIVGRIRTEYLHKTQKAIEQAQQTVQRILENSDKASDKAEAARKITKYTKQLGEIGIYDEAIAHVANLRIELDLDDGVKANYEKFQGIEVAQEGKKALKIDLLAPLK